MPDRSFLARVRQKLPDLHPAERRLGELVCDFPGELASYSASELAELAQVSNATVTRFVRRLGYASYEDARRDARAESLSGSRLYLQQSDDPSDSDPDSFLNVDIRNIRDTMEHLTNDDIDAVAQAILAARRVWCVGFRAANPLANYLQWQILQAVDDSVAVPGGGQTMGEHIARTLPSDVVIVFGLRRRVADLDAILESFINTGATVFYITDEGVTENRNVARHFRCATQSSGPLFSHVGVMALINIVANRTIELASESGRKKLRAIESFNEALGEL
ncbi:MurR/RpiR family transcriptional regulator [Pseudooceanicola sp. MF1-13]|uniref:MurR/RpiR family transcriptional regulator n=1 Tax=Pseudooceanicola sp. MF1-13 TaxID=3379095 RepID=UPI0038926633